MDNESLSQELESLLKNHDWYSDYAWSDDNRVYRAGKDMQDQINSLINQLGPEGKILYNTTIKK